jgi:DNA-directed RNA polymerase sigma subunit (sigma70/sigma32)
MEGAVQQSVAVRTRSQTLGIRIVERVELRTGSFLMALEKEARRRLKPLLRSLPLVSRREVQRLSLRIARLERRLQSHRDPSVARTLLSLMAPTNRHVDVSLAGQTLVEEVEQTLLQNLTADEERALRVRFGFGNGPREASAARANVRRIERRALMKLWQSSRRTES